MRGTIRCGRVGLVLLVGGLFFAFGVSGAAAAPAIESASCLPVSGNNVSCTSVPNLATVGNGSCNGTYNANCYSDAALTSVGGNSCNTPPGTTGWGACSGNGQLRSVGANSCNGSGDPRGVQYGACASNGQLTSVGANSCNSSGNFAGGCANGGLTSVGDNSCNGNMGLGACNFIKSAVGNCQYNVVVVAACPNSPDLTGPVASPMQEPAANSAGWINHTGLVTIKWNWRPGKGGFALAPSGTTNCQATPMGDTAYCSGVYCPATTFLSVGEGTYHFAATCMDVNYLSAFSGYYPVKVDATPPADAPVMTGTMGLNGWYTSNVSVAWNWTDAGSGVDPLHCTQTSTSSDEGATVTASSPCTDLAGNTASDSRSFKIDKTPSADAPVMTGTMGLNGWYTSNVSVAWNWTDAGSGVKPASCTTSSTAAEQGSITLMASCQDLAGNTGSGSYTAKVDTIPPVLSIPANVTANATSPAGATITFAAPATDTGDSGVASVVCSPLSGTLFAISTTTVHCTATDVAGNTTHGSFTVHVKSAAEQLVDLGTAVTGVGPGTNLADKVTSIKGYVATNNKTDACGTLRAFINQVKALTGKKITTAQAASFISLAQSIEATLGC